MDLMKILAATTLMGMLSMNAAIATTCNIDVIVNGAKTKQTHTSCVDTTTATCLNACDTDYKDLFPSSASDTSKTKMMIAMIPIAISDLGLSGTPLSNMRDCCKVYNGNLDCGV